MSRSRLRYGHFRSVLVCTTAAAVTLGMVDDPVVAERGVLTAPAEAWNLAVRRAEVIRELAAQRVVGLEAADAAAAQLGVPRRQVYVLVGRWRPRTPIATAKGKVSVEPAGSSGSAGDSYSYGRGQGTSRQMIRRARTLRRSFRRARAACA